MAMTFEGLLMSHHGLVVVKTVKMKRDVCFGRLQLLMGIVGLKHLMEEGELLEVE